MGSCSSSHKSSRDNGSSNDFLMITEKSSSIRMQDRSIEVVDVLVEAAQNKKVVELENTMNRQQHPDPPSSPPQSDAIPPPPPYASTRMLMNDDAASTTTTASSQLSNASSALTQTPCLKLNLSSQKSSTKSSDRNNQSFDRARTYSTSSICSLTSTYEDHSSYEEMELALSRRHGTSHSFGSGTGPFNVTIAKRHSSADANLDVFRGIRSKHEVRDHKNAQLEKINEAKAKASSVDDSANGTVELVVKQTMSFASDMLKKWQEGGVGATAATSANYSSSNKNGKKGDDEALVAKQAADVGGGIGSTKRHKQRNHSLKRQQRQSVAAKEPSVPADHAAKGADDLPQPTNCFSSPGGPFSVDLLSCNNFNSILEAFHQKQDDLCNAQTNDGGGRFRRRTWTAPAAFNCAGLNVVEEGEEQEQEQERKNEQMRLLAAVEGERDTEQSREVDDEGSAASTLSPFISCYNPTGGTGCGAAFCEANNFANLNCARSEKNHV